MFYKFDFDLIEKSTANMNINRYIILFISSILLIASCRKDVDINQVIDIEYPTEEYINTNIKGTVKDNRNNSIQNASVQIGSIIITTDFNGYFYFENISGKKSGDIIKVFKSGMRTVYKSFIPQSETTLFIDIVLDPENGAIIFNTNDSDKFFSTKTSEITINGKNFTSGSTKYTGQVNANVLLSSEKDNSFFDVQIGQCVGYDKYFKTKGIRSFGMVGLEMKDNNGADIVPGDSTYIAIKIFTSSQNIENECPVWKFNFEKNKWLETSIIAKYLNQSNPYYYAEVYESGYYMIGSKFDVELKEFNIKSQENYDLQFINTSIQNKELNFKIDQRTSQNGTIISYIPDESDSKLFISVNNQKIENVVSSITEKDVKIQTNTRPVNFKTQLYNCNGEKLSIGYITIIINNDTTFYQPNNEGIVDFNLNVPTITHNLSWFASDPKNNINTSTHVYEVVDTINLKELYACEDSFASVEVDGITEKYDINSLEFFGNSFNVNFSRNGYSLEIWISDYKGVGNYTYENLLITLTRGGKQLTFSNSNDIRIEIIEAGNNIIRGIIDGDYLNALDHSEVGKMKIYFSARTD